MRKTRRVKSDFFAEFYVDLYILVTFHYILISNMKSEYCSYICATNSQRHQARRSIFSVTVLDERLC